MDALVMQTREQQLLPECEYQWISFQSHQYKRLVCPADLEKQPQQTWLLLK